MGGNSPNLDRARDHFFRSRWPDAMKEAEDRGEAVDKEAVAGLWELADMYVPKDVRELGERHGSPALTAELWRSAFIQGWRAAMRSRHEAEQRNEAK